MWENLKSSVLVANPQLYDYFHSLKFEGDKVEFADGAGQAIITIAFGKFAFRQIEPLIAEFEFYDIIEVNPYRKNEKVRDVEPFKIKCHKEEGTFAFWFQAIWNVPNEEDYPCLVCQDRYVFDFDPISFGLENQKHSLYYKIEKRDFSQSARYFYERDKIQRLKFKEVLELGISEEMLKTESGVV